MSGGIQGNMAECASTTCTNVHGNIKPPSNNKVDDYPGEVYLSRAKVRCNWPVWVGEGFAGHWGGGSLNTAAM